MNADPVLVHLDRHLRAGAWALPASGGLLVLGTLTHQPDSTTDFPGYADYVTTDVFLLSHLVASIGGAALGILGTVCVAVLLAAQSEPARRGLLLGAALTTAAHVLNTALFGVAAFAQPAIGRAYQRGVADAVGLNSDVYGPELGATAALALLLWTTGAVLVGNGLRRSSSRLRGPGLAYAVTLPVFFLSGLPGGPVQPVAAAVFTACAVLVVRRLPRSEAPDVDRGAVSAGSRRP
jgi:hypothetical protein